MSESHRPVQVMVVDDSTVIRGLLTRIIEGEPDMRVVASVANGRTAVEMLRHKEVDVILLDIEMPEMDGLTALPLLLKERPDLPVIMASSLTQRGAEVTMRALALGAADSVPKPSSLSAVSGMAAIADELVAKIRALGRAGRTRRAPRAVPESPRQERAERPSGFTLPMHAPHDASVHVLAIASSTGGPNALAKLLSRLPRDFPLPIVIVQHMPPIFTAALAERLQRETGRPCREAKNSEPLLAGHTYIAPGDYHMTVMTAERQPILRLDQSPPVNFCRPAADPMFRSVAGVFGGGVLAVVLTGMGEDGMRGCQEVARRGGRILVQDEASSVVWGMPGAVSRAGLASAALPLDRLADRIQQLCSGAGAAL